jgi:hypothetical protein
VPIDTPVLATPTVPPFAFVIENAYGTQDCSKTEISGYLLDKSRQGLSGYKVRVGNVNGSWSALSGATGTDGKYSVRLALTPTAGRWYAVIEDSAGKEISPRAQIETTASSCSPGQSGIQIGRVDFRKDY